MPWRALRRHFSREHRIDGSRRKCSWVSLGTFSSRSCKEKGPSFCLWTATPATTLWQSPICVVRMAWCHPRAQYHPTVSARTKPMAHRPEFESPHKPYCWRNNWKDRGERIVQLDSWEIFLHVNMWTVIVASTRGRLEEFQWAHSPPERADPPVLYCMFASLSLFLFFFSVLK